MTKTTDKAGKEIKPMENMFWLDGYKGECSSGYFIRNNLFKMIAEFKEKGFEVVGIKVQPDSYNLEFFCKEPNKKSKEDKEVKSC